MAFKEFSNLNAKYLHDTAKIISDKQQYDLNEQTDVWIKNNLLPILFDTAKKGEFEWVGHIVGFYHGGKYCTKFESHNAPPYGLNMQRIKMQVEKLGFTIWNFTNNLMIIRW